MGLELGQVIDGKYRIVRLLGEGGMGAVYEGENVRIHRRVAIKVLHANVAGNADSVQRFEREAQAAGRIGSDHIVEVLDLGNLPAGDRYMVMEYLDGESLSQRIQSRGRLDPREAGPLLLQLLEGLASAHGAGIIHRDLKPDNVFLLRSRKGQGDFVKILDFGISKFNALNADSAMSKTRTGAVMGTPYYMSPEQAKGAREMDHRSDLYSSAVILYESITGQVPFDAETFNELLFKIALDAPVPPQRHAPELDPGFSAIVLKGMAREPKDRFQSAQEFAAAIEGWLAAVHGWGPAMQGLPPPRPPAPSAPMYGPTPTAPTPMLAQTPAPWSQTGATEETVPAKPPPPKKSYAAAIAAAVGVIVVGAGIALGVRVLGSSPAPVSAAPPAPAAANAPTEPKVAAEPAPPAPAVLPTPSPAPAPQGSAANVEARIVEAPVGSARKDVAMPPPPKHLATKRALSGSPAPGPAAPATPAPPAAPTDGTSVTARKIRTEL